MENCGRVDVLASDSYQRMLMGQEGPSARQRHRRFFAKVVALNVLMFFIEAAAGGPARSTALMADALDVLGHTRRAGNLLRVEDRPFGKGLSDCGPSHPRRQIRAS